MIHTKITKALLLCTCLLAWNDVCQAAIEKTDTNVAIYMKDGPGGPGGIFEVYLDSDRSTKLFDTFCVEVTEFVSLPGTYTANFSNVTNAGGRTLRDEVAWLYIEYSKGAGSAVHTLFNSYAQSMAVSANSLQRAIWEFMYEGMVSPPSIPATSPAYHADLRTDLKSAASTAIGLGWENLETNPDGWVQIMNLTRNGNKHQDQLILFPPDPDDSGVVPEPSTLVVWTLLVGCAGVVLSRRSAARN